MRTGKYLHVLCLRLTSLILSFMSRWRVYDIGDPYLLYRINVTVQQLDYYRKSSEEDSESDESREVWRTVGYATIGPERIGDNTNRKKPGVTSGPEVLHSL